MWQKPQMPQTLRILPMLMRYSKGNVKIDRLTSLGSIGNKKIKSQMISNFQLMTNDAVNKVSTIER
jgi:hypothetical protein